MEKPRFNSLYFILFVLIAMQITVNVAPDKMQNTVQKVVFTAGLAIMIAGSMWRIVQRTKKVSEKKGTITQAVGTLVAVLTQLSVLVW